MQLRNCILIALAFDASPEEVDAAHDAIDRQFGGTGSVNPQLLVSATVDPQTGATQTTGTGTPMSETPSVAGKLDAAGLPWDERIHSSNQAFTDKGVWRARRNVDAALKSKVEAELRATVGANAAAAPPAPPAPPAPAGNLPPLPGAALPDPAYTALVQLIAQNTQSAANASGRITEEWLRQVLSHFGVAEGNLQNLAHAPQLVPQIDSYIRQALGQ